MTRSPTSRSSSAQAPLADGSGPRSAATGMRDPRARATRPFKAGRSRTDDSHTDISRAAIESTRAFPTPFPRNRARIRRGADDAEAEPPPDPGRALDRLPPGRVDGAERKRGARHRDHGAAGRRRLRKRARQCCRDTRVGSRSAKPPRVRTPAGRRRAARPREHGPAGCDRDPARVDRASPARVRRSCRLRRSGGRALMGRAQLRLRGAGTRGQAVRRVAGRRARARDSTARSGRGRRLACRVSRCETPRRPRALPSSPGGGRPPGRGAARGRRLGPEARSDDEQARGARHRPRSHHCSRVHPGRRVRKTRWASVAHPAQRRIPS